MSKNITVKKYGVTIDEENYKFDILVEINNYNLSFFKDKPLTYKVDFNTNKLIVSYKTNKIFFNLDDKKLLYYSIKSLEILIHCVNANDFGNIKYTLKAELA